MVRRIEVLQLPSQRHVRRHLHPRIDYRYARTDHSAVTFYRLLVIRLVHQHRVQPPLFADPFVQLYMHVRVRFAGDVVLLRAYMTTGQRKRRTVLAAKRTLLRRCVPDLSLHR